MAAGAAAAAGHPSRRPPPPPPLPRRYTLRKGPLIIFGSDNGISRAFRNLPGVEVASVDRLNLLQARARPRALLLACSARLRLQPAAPRASSRAPSPPLRAPTLTPHAPSPHAPTPAQLAPGGHLGRFCVWTKSAFEALDKVYGTTSSPSEAKKGYKLPRPMMANADVARLINSDEVQSVVRPPKEAAIKSRPLKKNPLKNLGALVKLNPHAIVTRRNAVLAAEARGKVRAEKLAKLRDGKPTGTPKKAKDVKAVGQAFYKQMVVDSEYQGEDYEVFSKWLGTTE